MMLAANDDSKIIIGKDEVVNVLHDEEGMNSVVHTRIDEVNQNNCIYYITKEKKCNKIPYKPLALLHETYNLHSRLPYSLHIYYAARKFDRYIKNKFQT